MSLLDDVTQYQAQQQAREQADLQAIPTAINTFFTAQQQAHKNLLDELTLKVTAAKEGFAIDPRRGIIMRDPGLVNPVDQFIKSGQLADAQLKLAQLGVPATSIATTPAVTPSVSPRVTMPTTGIPDLIPTETNILGVPTKFVSASGIAAQKRAEQLAESKFKKEELKKELDSIFALESTIPRTTGGVPQRHIQGFQNALRGFGQRDPIGENIATYLKSINLITPRIARAAGDTANIAVQERKFSQEIFPTLSDSRGTAAKKRAFMEQFTKAVDNQDKNEIKKLLDVQGVPYFDFSRNAWVGMTAREQASTLVPPGASSTTTPSTSSQIGRFTVRMR